MAARFRTSFVTACGFLLSLLTTSVMAQNILDLEVIRDADPELRHLLREKQHLSRDLLDLERRVQRVRYRIKNVDRIVGTQKELREATQQLKAAESSHEEELAKKLKARIEVLRRRFDHLREAQQIDEQITEHQTLISRLHQVEGMREASRTATYLASTVGDLKKLQEIRLMLIAMDSGIADGVRNKFEEQLRELEQRVDADEELVTHARRLLQKIQQDPDEDVKDFASDMEELRRELETARKKENQTSSDRVPAANDRSDLHRDDESSNASDNYGGKQGKLESGEFFVTQTWSQETDFKRPFYVRVPDLAETKQTSEPSKLPVFIFLHGNGGNAAGAMRGFMNRHPNLSAKYVMVFPNGYRESWNIVSERSKADDRGFLESIIEDLSQHSNVDENNFSVMGSSNGAALANQLAIESKLPNIRNYVTAVSPLNSYQYDGTNFKAKGETNDYQTAVEPMLGKRLMNVSGTDDQLVPYQGGFSKAIPAKNGKLSFVDAEQSTFLWAQRMGYRGEKLGQPSRIEEGLEVFSYLDDDVIHYKVLGEGHGASRAINEDHLLDFLRGAHD